MEIILLERVPKLGQMGEIVRVKDGYARNFLLPNGKALRATDANKQKFESERAQLEARNLERRSEAESVSEKLTGQTFVIIRQAGETGQLYGSVATRDIAETATENGFTVDRKQVRLDRPIKSIGLHSLLIQLHPEVEVDITVNVARSPDEAERQAAGEDLTQRDREAFEFDAEEEEDESPAVEDIFEAPPEELLADEDADSTSDDEGETSSSVGDAPDEEVKRDDA